MCTSRAQRDGGLTWGVPEVIATHPQAHLCEPGAIRSPDGKQIAVLLRENSRRLNSFVIFSDDEGQTWSQPRPLPGSLTGDRHAGRYAPDGRLLVTFRDTTLESPTKGDWVGWVGTYDDIVQGHQGQYRVRLMKNHKGADCAYPGLELLPDGTFVTTTYGHWTNGESPYVVSVRFTLQEIDAQANIPDAVRWLEAKSKEMIRASRRTMNSGIAAFPPQVGSGYEAFWLRDYAYMLEGCAEAFSDRELRDACLLFVNSIAADGAGVDCVKFDGTVIYKPGYGTMGENPVATAGRSPWTWPGTRIADYRISNWSSKSWTGWSGRWRRCRETRRPASSTSSPRATTAAPTVSPTRCGSKGTSCSLRCCGFRPLDNWPIY